MNTLSRQLTASFFPSTSDFYIFRKHWSNLVNSDRKYELKAVHHLAYLVLCGKDWRKAFTFPTNSNKLNNGYTPELYRALQQIGSIYQEPYVLTPFDGFVSKEAIVGARNYLSHVLVSPPKVDASGTYNCTAYTIPAKENTGGKP